MLPSGPVSPPDRMGRPRGCEASRRCSMTAPLSATPKRNDWAQSQAAWKPTAHQRDPVRQRLREKTRATAPALRRPIEDSPGLEW